MSVGKANLDLGKVLARLETKFGPGLTDGQKFIPEEMTFRQWCEKLATEGLKVDRKPFKLDNRPCMAWVYDQFPTTREEAYGLTLVLMKCAQVGFTVLEMLAAIYYGLKFMPCFVGIYLPDMKLAAAISTNRFMPIMRTTDAYKLLRKGDDGAPKRGEGNVMIRTMGDSNFGFFWTSGKAMTESFPVDVLCFDEVQEMTIDDVEKTAERMSGSEIRFQFMGSTANWPDADIHHWYKLGTRHSFWTLCKSCGRHERLDEAFPACIKFDPTIDDYRYCCVHCGGWIDDPQCGEWRAEDDDALIYRGIKSISFHQMLSPTVSAREILDKYTRATSMQNFYNRVLGRPYSDPSQIPINQEVLNKCVAAGAAAGVQWRDRGVNTYMGIDQMGRFNVVLIKERLADGRQATIHAEEIYDPDPFARCSELMDRYGVAVCCVEKNPNFNDAHRFANRHLGRVFLADYADLKDDMLVWKDAVVTKADRKTEFEERERYVVTLNQYKCMQVAFARMLNQTCLFPDPDGLMQDIIEKGEKRRVAILRERVFLHFTKTALIVERKVESEGKKKPVGIKEFRTRVVKVGIDPHFSYANMLCDVAWARAWGTTSLTIPQAGSTVEERRVQSIEKNMPGLPIPVLQMLDPLPRGEVCGACYSFDANGSRCRDRDLLVGANDQGCHLFVVKSAA